MEIDSIKQMYLIHVREGVDLFKFDVYPSRDVAKRMCVGTMAIGKEEAIKVYNFLRSYFEKSPLPAEVTQINLTGQKMKQVPAQFRPPNTADLMDAESIQKENDGRTSMEPVGEPLPKKFNPLIRTEGVTLEEASQM